MAKLDPASAIDKGQFFLNRETAWLLEIRRQDLFWSRERRASDDSRVLVSAWYSVIASWNEISGTKQCRRRRWHVGRSMATHESTLSQRCGSAARSPHQLQPDASAP